MDPDSYATQLKQLMQSVKPPSVRKHPHRNTHVSPSCPFVFVRHDAVKKTLQAYLKCSTEQTSTTPWTFRDTRKSYHWIASSQPTWTDHLLHPLTFHPQQTLHQNNHNLRHLRPHPLHYHITIRHYPHYQIWPPCPLAKEICTLHIVPLIVATPTIYIHYH